MTRPFVPPTPVRVDAAPDLTGKGVTIAFLDSGFFPHPDLLKPKNRILAHVDVSSDKVEEVPDQSPDPTDWHGTQTTVVSVGSGFSSEGLYPGIARDAEVVLVKVGNNGVIDEPAIARALRWVLDHHERYGIRIVSVSLGGENDVPYQQSEVNQLAKEVVAKGMVVIVAAGNSGCTDDPRTVPPANSPAVITVGGYVSYFEAGDMDVEMYCSNFGPTADGVLKPEVIAPAAWIAAPILPKTPAYKRAQALWDLAGMENAHLAKRAAVLAHEAELPKTLIKRPPSAIRDYISQVILKEKIVGPSHQHVDGTSFAAPIVSSIVAQMLEAAPQLTPPAIKAILISSADRVPSVSLLRQGYGVVNAKRAVELARSGRFNHDIRSFLPPRMEGDELVFFYHDDQAKTVMLMGDFNDWKPLVNEFRRDGNGVWRAKIPKLAPGKHKYKFLVDGHRWVEDPSNGLKEPDGHEGFNSILNVVPDCDPDTGICVVG